MTLRTIALLAVLSLGASSFAAQTAPSHQGWLEIPVPEKRPEPTEEALAEGKRIYDFRCSPCHGVTGLADGPAAKYLEPRPRDFTFGNFKFRTTKFSEMPLDEDLYRTITRGVPGTAMPSWITLSPEERWKVIYWVKKLGEDFFGDPEFDPRRTDPDTGEKFIIGIPALGPTTPEIVEEGRKVYLRAGCKECHGETGRGNGTSSGKQFDYLKNRILPRDLTKGWHYKAGNKVEDIWRTLSTGLNGTPMPSFINSLDKESPEKDEKDRIAIAHFVRSIVIEDPDSEETLLVVKKVAGPLPRDPGDAIWDESDEISFRLFGQVTRRPRWQTPAVDQLRVRALYDGDEIALRLVYDDRTKDVEHLDPDIVTEETTYPELDLDDYEFNRVKFRDAVAVQFPIKEQEGAKRPYFIYGQLDNPVNLWRHRADGQGDEAFEELTAKGPEKIATQAKEDQALSGGAVFDQGQWRVVLKRSLRTGNEKGDVQMEPGAYVPFTVMAWDGGNGESGLRQSLSSWYNMRLETPTPPRAYYLALLGIVAAALGEGVLLFKARSGNA